MESEALTTYEESWIQVLAELRDSAGTEVLNEFVGEIDPSADASCFDDLEEWERVSLGPAYREEFVRFTALGCQWQTVSLDLFAAGEFRLASLPLAVHEDPPGFSSSRYSEDPEVWYCDREGLWRMDLDYRRYLETLRITKGAFGWQHVFTEAPLAAGEFQSTADELRAMLDVLPQLFPDHDYSDLRARLQQRL